MIPGSGAHIGVALGGRNRTWRGFSDLARYRRLPKSPFPGEAFRGALERLRKEHEIHIYPDVGHAFANPTGVNYDAQAADDAWQKTIDFLGRHLSTSGDSDGS